MQHSIEVEFKYQILNESVINSFLDSLTLQSEKRVIDMYMDTTDAQLFQRGIFIRERDNKKLDFKFNLAALQDPNYIDNHEHCDEYSFNLPLKDTDMGLINEVCTLIGIEPIAHPDLEAFKQMNNFVDSVLIDRMRKTFTDGKFTIVYDDVMNLGKFIEIEFLATSDTELDSLKTEMKQKLSGLELKRITTGYNELYWRKHDIAIYQKGKYLLDEDKVMLNF